MLSKGTIIFIIFALLWEIGVGVLYGLLYGYSESTFLSMESGTTVFSYNLTSTASTYFKANTTQFPFPLIAVAVAIILLIVGLAIVAGYIERSTVVGVTFTLLIFALTMQNFFIFRGLLNRLGLNDASATANLASFSYPQINYINFGNDLQSGFSLPSASFLDAVGASLAIYAGYTAVIGRISLGEVFFLSWIGTFIYELNSQILWRLFIPDNGYPSRAFAYGGTLGLVSSFILGQREKTKNNANYKSNYKTMAIAFLGIIFVWCSFPVLVLSNVYTSTTGKVVATAGQVNIWLALASGVLGCFAASSLQYRKFSIHDLIFASITGAIAFSSSTDISYNPGAATAIGFVVGFVLSYAHTVLKRKVNQTGVLDSNSALLHFILPSLFAAISSAVLQGVGQSKTSTIYYSYVNSTIRNGTATYPAYTGSGRNETTQGGFQMVGWAISVAFGIGGGLIIGLIYRLLSGFQKSQDFFNDESVFTFALPSLPSVKKRKKLQIQAPAESAKQL